jgi:cytochrome c551/c552
MPYLQNRRSIAALALSAGVILACLAKADPVTITLPPETTKLRASVLPGYVTATQKCTICHSADYISYQTPGMNQVQWTAEAAKMQHAYGAPLDDDDVRRIGAYLAVTYGTAKANDAAVAEADKPVLASPASTKVATPLAEAVDAKALLNSNGCLGCHSVDKKIVGPAFHDVADKYRGQAQALEKVEASIHQGGVGKWGQVPMPPMGALSEAQLKALAEYVLKQ